MLSTTSSFSFVEQASAILSQHPHLGNRKVKCRAKDANLVIEGEVNSYYEKQLAQEALRNVEGIGQVENQLDVVPK
jgi:osmotically-inducible protein OsmY